MFEGARRYVVVLNHEGRHSIWDADRAIPQGWSPDGFSGAKAEALAHIRETRTAMRPSNARAEGAREGAAAAGDG
jgi:MbtH protein